MEKTDSAEAGTNARQLEFSHIANQGAKWHTLKKQAFFFYKVKYILS